MGLEDMKVLPHLVKPVTLILSVVFFVFILCGRGSWQPIVMAVLQLLFTSAVFIFFFMNASQVVHNPYWPQFEMGYSLCFALGDLISFIICLVRVFSHFNFFILLCMFLTAMLAVIFGFNFLQIYRICTTNSSTDASASNQATATPPPNFNSGVNPGV